MFRPTQSLFQQQVQQEVKKQLQFTIARTQSNNLPVYLKYTGGARRVPVTEVRKYTGDVNQLQLELQRLVGSHVNIKRGENSLYITGNFVSKVRDHLKAIGF
eukprot:UN00700